MTQKRPLVSHFSTARRGRVSAINMIALWSAVAFRAAISRFAAGTYLFGRSLLATRGY